MFKVLFWIIFGGWWVWMLLFMAYFDMKYAHREMKSKWMPAYFLFMATTLGICLLLA
jgi:hypothetical protein